MKKSTIEIDNENRAYLTLYIKRHNRADELAIKFKIDTGADNTTISLKDLAKLGYTENDIRSLMKSSGGGSLANGEGSDWYSIDLSLEHILGMVIPNGYKFPFICLSRRTIKIPEGCTTGCELTGDNFNGFRSLVGNDILSCFEININRSNRQITFNRSSEIAIRNKQYPNREVHELLTDTKESELSEDAKIILNIIEKKGYIEEQTKDSTTHYGVDMNIASAIHELIKRKIVVKDSNSTKYILVNK